jgi:hypothetical protein
VLALTTTTAIAAKPRFSSAIVFSLSTPDLNAAQAALQGFAANLHDDSDRPIALHASGDLSDLVPGKKYELALNAKGKAEIVCDDDHYHSSSPKWVDVTASGRTQPFVASSDQASFDVEVNELKIDKNACDSDYGVHYTRPRVTILKVLYSGGDVLLFEQKGNGKDTDEPPLALNGKDKSKPVDRVQFSKCKTKNLMVSCKQKGGG